MELQDTGELDAIFGIFDALEDLTVPQPDPWCDIAALIPYLTVILERHKTTSTEPAERNALGLIRCLRDSLVLHRRIQQQKIKVQSRETRINKI